MKKISINYLFVMLFTFFCKNVFSLIQYDSFNDDVVVTNEENKKNDKEVLAEKSYSAFFSNDRTGVQENELIDLLYRGLVPASVLKQNKIQIHDLDQKIERDPKYLILLTSFKMEDELMFLYQKILNMAESGNAFAQFAMGEMYYKGIAVAQNNDKAFKWYDLAAKQELALAQNNLGVMYARKKIGFWNNEKTVDCFKSAVLQYLSNAQNNLGNMYYYGKGIYQDDESAFYYYQLAARQGNVLAQTNLGSMYFLGRATVQNYEKAFKWFKRAEMQGDSFASAYLGFMYENGFFVQKDHDEAMKYYLKAGDAYWSKQHLLKCNVYNENSFLKNIKLFFIKLMNKRSVLGAKNNTNLDLEEDVCKSSECYNLSTIQDNMAKLKSKHDILAERNNVDSLLVKDDGYKIPELYNLYKELSEFEDLFIDHLKGLTESGMLINCVDVTDKYESVLDANLAFVKVYNNEFGNFMCIGENNVKNADFIFSILPKLLGIHNKHPLFQYYNDLKIYRMWYETDSSINQNETSANSFDEPDKFKKIREEIMNIDERINNVFLNNTNGNEDVEIIADLEQQKRLLVVQLAVQQRKLSSNSFDEVQKFQENLACYDEAIEAFQKKLDTRTEFFNEYSGLIDDLKKQKELRQSRQDLGHIDALISELDKEFQEYQEMYQQIVMLIQDNVGNRNHLFLEEHSFIK